jgi:hypothetical protein
MPDPFASVRTRFLAQIEAAANDLDRAMAGTSAVTTALEEGRAIERERLSALLEDRAVQLSRIGRSEAALQLRIVRGQL